MQSKNQSINIGVPRLILANYYLDSYILPFSKKKKMLKKKKKEEKLGGGGGRRENGRRGDIDDPLLIHQFSSLARTKH